MRRYPLLAFTASLVFVVAATAQADPNGGRRLARANQLHPSPMAVVVLPRFAVASEDQPSAQSSAVKAQLQINQRLKQRS